MNKFDNIPEGWMVKKLGDIFIPQKNFSFSREQLTEEKKDVACIHYGDIHQKYNSQLDFEKETLPFIANNNTNYKNNDFIKEGDLILADASEDYDGIGKSCVALNIENRKVVSGLHTFLLRDSNFKLNNLYKAYFLYSYKNKKKLMKIANGISVLGISKNNLLNIEIIIPPLEEQKRIAEVLSDCDAVIDVNKEKLKLLKKRKKSLMQKLLTPKPHWKEQELKNLGKTYNGLTGKNKDDFGTGKPYISYMNAYSNSQTNTREFEFVRIEPKDKQNRVKYGDIIFTVSSETPNEVGISSVILDSVDELYLNSFCFGYILHNFKTLEPKFARYLFRSQGFRKSMLRLAQGSSRYNLAKTAFLKTTILFPTIKEQEEIAEILSDADDEIEEFKNKIKKLEKVKEIPNAKITNWQSENII